MSPRRCRRRSTHGVTVRLGERHRNRRGSGQRRSESTPDERTHSAAGDRRARHPAEHAVGRTGGRHPGRIRGDRRGRRTLRTCPESMRWVMSPSRSTSSPSEQYVVSCRSSFSSGLAAWFPPWARVASAALGALLQARGYRVRLRKLDPYLNVDPGTMSPYQHGEVFVTDDGAETDLDLGHYERFTGRPAKRQDNITTGRIYQEILDQGAPRRLSWRHHPGDPARHQRDQGFRSRRQRRLRFRAGRDRWHGRRHREPAVPGSDPPARQRTAAPACDLHPSDADAVHSDAGELKTKPTQHSVRSCASIGIQPDILLCRTDRPIPKEERRKLALFCNVRESAVIEARDVDNIYAVPEAYSAEGLDSEVLAAFGLDPEPAARPRALAAASTSASAIRRAT